MKIDCRFPRNGIEHLSGCRVLVAIVEVIDSIEVN